MPWTAYLGYQVNYEHSIREYAAAGYNLILVVGAEFSNACLAVGKDYPDVMIADFNGSTAQEPNVATYRYTTTETGFLAGVATDVCLKEGRKVALLPREMLFGRAQLKNMLTASEYGCAIIPPMLTFYNKVQTLKQQMDHIVGKTLMLFQISYSKFHPGMEAQRRL